MNWVTNTLITGYSLHNDCLIRGKQANCPTNNNNKVNVPLVIEYHSLPSLISMSHKDNHYNYNIINNTSNNNNNNCYSYYNKQVYKYSIR